MPGILIETRESGRSQSVYLGQEITPFWKPPTKEPTFAGQIRMRSQVFWLEGSPGYLIVNPTNFGLLEYVAFADLARKWGKLSCTLTIGETKHKTIALPKPFHAVYHSSGVPFATPSLEWERYRFSGWHRITGEPIHAFSQKPDQNFGLLKNIKVLIERTNV